MFTSEDKTAMQAALRAAKRAAKAGETPIGAALAVGGKVLAVAGNTRERKNDVAGHAEIAVLRKAAKLRGDWRFPDATLYVTLEPCPMCTGAILAARVGRVVFGANSASFGAMGSVVDLPSLPLGAHPTVERGLLSEESSALLRAFFRRRREEEPYTYKEKGDPVCDMTK